MAAKTKRKSGTGAATKPAPKKPASKKSAVKKSAAKKPSTTRGSALDATTITVKTKENPYKGSRGERFGLLRSGMTVAEYVAAAETRGHKRARVVGGLRLFEKDKHITLSGRH